jgi:hypothetical protein
MSPLAEGRHQAAAAHRVGRIARIEHDGEGLHSKEPGRTVTVSAGQTLTVTFILDTRIRCRWRHQFAACPLGTRCPWVRREAAADKEPTRKCLRRTMPEKLTFTGDLKALKNDSYGRAPERSNSISGHT